MLLEKYMRREHQPSRRDDKFVSGKSGRGKELINARAGAVQPLMQNREQGKERVMSAPC